MRLRIASIEMIGITLLVAALLAKFFWPLFTYDLPMGYDVGFYRYLFLRHAEGFPPFWLADLPPWARGHPLGLFFFTTILVRMGLPVDWLIGWMWNLFPVVLAAVFAFVIGRRDGKMIGILLLLAAFLSPAFYDGFAAMYWKTFAALLFCVLAFDMLGKKRWMGGFVFGFLAVATHHQTGLLFGLCLGTWWMMEVLRGQLPGRQGRTAALVGLSILALGLLTYVPIWHESIGDVWRFLLEGPTDKGGSFPPPLFYLRYGGVLLAVGLYGFAISWRERRGTPWQLAVLWSACFVVFQLLFFRRFFLQLDFFLLPFAAKGMWDLWQNMRSLWVRALLILLMIVQALLSLSLLPQRGSLIDAETFDAVQRLPSIPVTTTILIPENESAVILRGWMPHHTVVAPGLFDDVWSYENWQKFLLGTHEDRVWLFTYLKHPIVLFVTPFFRSYYTEYADKFLSDPCFQPTEDPFMYTVSC